MDRPAHVSSIEAVQEFRAALAAFCEEIRSGLLSVEHEARHAAEWILREQLSRWKKVVRDREDDLTHARVELSRRRVTQTAGGARPDCTEQQKAVRRAEERLREALDKVDRCKQWGSVLLPRALDEFRGPARQLDLLVNGRPPPAVAFLERVLERLETYLNLPAPAGPPPDPGHAPEKE